MTTQVFNPEQVDALAAHFPRRTEPNFAWGNAMSIMSNLPMLRGLWGFGSVDENGALYDASGQGRTLTNNNTVPFGISVLAPYADFTAATLHNFSRADEAGLDITGALTMGGWFYHDVIGKPMMAKWNSLAGANQRAFSLIRGFGPVYFLVSSLGTAASVVMVGSVNNAPASTWVFIAGRFTPSTELAVFINTDKTTNLVGVPAAIFNSNAAFKIGLYDETPAANYFDGKASLCFLCNAALPDYMINGIFWHTKRMFGA